MKKLGRPWVHEAAMCDGCMQAPILGHRMKCQTWVFHDFCLKCYNIKQAMGKLGGCVFALIEVDSSTFYLPYQIYYYNCRKCYTIPIVGPRYKHTRLQDWDLCDYCYHTERRLTEDYVRINETRIETWNQSFSLGLHFHKECLACGQLPVCGPRFDTVSAIWGGVDVSLCLTCFDTKVSSKIINDVDFKRVERSEDSEVIHLRVLCCMQCGENPICGPAFINTRIPYDTLCLSCYQPSAWYTRVEPPKQYLDSEPDMASDSDMESQSSKFDSEDVYEIYNTKLTSSERKENGIEGDKSWSSAGHGISSGKTARGSSTDHTISIGETSRGSSTDHTISNGETPRGSSTDLTISSSETPRGNSTDHGISRGKTPRGFQEEDEDIQKLDSRLDSAVLAEKPNVNWEDIVGLENAKQALQEALVVPMKYPQFFESDRQPWRAFLLYGLQSYVAKAVATEIGSTFYNISASDLGSKWCGESERLVSLLFQKARKTAPSVIFIDEIDSIAGERKESDCTGVKTEILVQMQGVGKNNDKILVLAATNLPYRLDQAIRRRFEKQIYIPLPDQTARKEMFKIHLKKTPHSLNDEDFEDLAARTPGPGHGLELIVVHSVFAFSGSDVGVCVKDVLWAPIRQIQSAEFFRCHDSFWYACGPGDTGAVQTTLKDLEAKQLAEKVKPLPINRVDFDRTLAKQRPTVCVADLKLHQQFTAEFGEDGSETGQQEYPTLTSHTNPNHTTHMRSEIKGRSYRTFHKSKRRR